MLRTEQTSSLTSRKPPSEHYPSQLCVDPWICYTNYFEKYHLNCNSPFPNFRRLKFDESTENLWATFLRNLQFERNISKLNYSNSLNWYAHINHDLKLYLSRKSTFLFHLFVFINFTKKSMFFFSATSEQQQNFFVLLNINFEKLEI